MHNEDFIRVIKLWTMRWTGHVARIGGMRNTYKILVEYPEGKRLLGRHTLKCENNIKMGLTGIE